MDSLIEWGPTFHFDLTYGMIDSGYSYLDICYDYKETNESKGTLVVDISTNKKHVIWIGNKSQEQYNKNRIGEWQTISNSISLYDYNDKLDLANGGKVKIYYWNSQKRNLSLDNFKIRLRKNLMIY